MKPAQLHQRHIDSQFADDPVIVETAVETGCVSIDSPEQLPKSLQYLLASVPGLLFQHHPLGGGEPVPQFRPDVPSDDNHKYIFPKGVGSVISITPSMQRRLDADTSRASKILIVEGTKQNLFASTYAPASVVAVGVQGCFGWSHDGMAVAALDDLCKGRDVIVAFDADISSNWSVYDAAESLNTQLTMNGAKSITFLTVPGSKRTGLDDYIARRPPDNRAETLAKMVDNVVPFKKLGKPPRKSGALGVGSDTFIFISEELGEVVEAVLEIKNDSGVVSKEHLALTIAGVVNDGVMDRNVRRVSIVLHAAPRIVTIVEEKDYLTVGAEMKLSYDVELQRGPRGSCKTTIIKDIPDSELGKVRDWLARAGADGGLASLEGAGVSPLGQARIAEAMRNLADTDLGVERRTVTPHTGWVQDGDTAYWVDAGGAHGPDGKITTIKAQLEGSVASLSIPGFNETYTRDDVVKSIKATLGVCDWLYDSTSWIIGMSGFFYSLTPSHPDAALFFLGSGGSGKSSIVGAMASILSEKWGTDKDPMASVEGTVAYLSDLASQIHNCPLIVDDGRDRSSTRGQEEQDTAIDALIRVGYSGGGAARGKKVPGKSKDSWRQSAASSNRPFVIIAGETLPNSAPQSTIERILSVEIKTATSMRTAKDSPDGQSGHEHLVEISHSGALRPLVSYFLLQIAKSSTSSMNGLNIETGSKVDRLNNVRERIEKIRTEKAKKVLAKHWPKNVPATPRALQVPMTFIAGASLMFGAIKEFSKELGFDKAKIRALEDEWHQRIVLAAVSHTSINLAHRSDVDTIIALVQGAIASTRFGLDGETPGKTRIGKMLTPTIDGVKVPCIALIPSVVESLPGMPPNLQSRLSAVLVRGKDKRPKYKTDFGGDPVWCYVIRMSVLNKDVDDDDDTPPPPPAAAAAVARQSNGSLANESSDDDSFALEKELAADLAEKIDEKSFDDFGRDFEDFGRDFDEPLPEDFPALSAADFAEDNFVSVGA